MKSEKIALLGFGDIAKRLVPHLDGHKISAIKRTNAPDISVDQINMDCRNLETMCSVVSQGFDVIVMTFVPTAMSDQGYKEGYVDTVSCLLQALEKQNQQPRLILFISSTSVYSQKDHQWVDESSPAEPASYSGKRLVEAEQLLADSAYNTCSIRFSGIYGPGRRRLIDQVINQQGSPSEPVVYSNRIHSEDCAAVIAHLINYSLTHTLSPCYIASDCEPVPISDVKMWIAEQLGFGPDHLRPSDSVRGGRSSKRCSNQHLLDTGYEFIYPTFRQGYSTLLDTIEH